MPRSRSNVQARYYEGAWCPVGQKMSDCEVMFLGDSMFRYMAEQIPAQVHGFVPGVYFRSGAKVEDLCEAHHEYVSQKTQACVIHFGTNNLKQTSVSVTEVLDLYRDVLAAAREESPECEIFISTVIPRSINKWDNDAHVMAQKIGELNDNISKFNKLLRSLCTSESHLHFVSHDEFFSVDNSVQTQLLARDGLHLSKSGVSVVAKTLLNHLEAFQFPTNKVEVSQLPANQSVVEDQQNSCVGDLDNAPLGSEDSLGSDFPPLSPPARVGSTASPYLPLYPSLVVTREELRKVSPVAATLHKVSQSRHGKVPKEPKRGRLSTRKPLSARPKVKKEVSTHVRRKNIVWRADKPILITQNRFSVLSADDEVSLSVSTTSCRQTVSSHVSAYCSRSKVPSVSRSKVKVPPVSAKVPAHESSEPKSPRLSSSESKITSRVSITDSRVSSVSGSKAKTPFHESSDLKPKVALCLPVCDVKIPSYASASGSSVPSQVSSESVTTSRGFSSQPRVHCCASTVDTRTWDISQKADSFPLYLDSFSPVNVKSSSNEEPILSNFYSCSVSVKGYRRQFKSIEHAYQFYCAIFFGEDELAEAIFSSKSAAQAKFLSRRLLWHKENYPDLAHKWNCYKVTLMEDLLFEKSRCCKEFHDRLIATYPHRLTHNVFDGFWGFQDKAGHPGQDMFLKMLMKLRLRLILNSVQIYVPSSPVSAPRVSQQSPSSPVSAPRVSQQAPSSPVSASRASQQAPSSPVCRPRVSQQTSPVFAPRVSQQAPSSLVCGPRVSQQAPSSPVYAPHVSQQAPSSVSGHRVSLQAPSSPVSGSRVSQQAPSSPVSAPRVSQQTSPVFAPRVSQQAPSSLVCGPRVSQQASSSPVYAPHVSW